MKKKSDDPWRIAFDNSVLINAKRAGITDQDMQEIALALEEIRQLRYPFADHRCLPIKCTDGEWHRLKVAGKPWRVVLKFIVDEKIIVLVAILKRTDKTYLEVERLYEEEQQTA